MKILVVEDNVICQTAIYSILKNYGECHTANNGKEFLDYFSKSLESGEFYDLICLDIILPDTNGHDLLKEIRSTERKLNRYNYSKVIMTTSLDDYTNVKTSFLNYSNGYLTKPIRKDKLDHELKKLRLIN